MDAVIYNALTEDTGKKNHDEGILGEMYNMEVLSDANSQFECLMVIIRTTTCMISCSFMFKCQTNVLQWALYACLDDCWVFKGLIEINVEWFFEPIYMKFCFRTIQNTMHK